MLPVLNIGPLALQTSGLVLLLSTWVALNVIERAAPRYQTPPNQLYNLALLAILAGMVGGRVVGESDSKGAFPRANPKTPQDVLATLYRHLGVDTEAQYLNATGRPIPVLPSGRPIEELC